MDKELVDRTWACLPREFKEEVKELYTDALDASNSPHEPDDRKWGNYRVTLLEKLFGSKCMPDEPTVAENATTTEQKPFKYSIGQKVILHFYGGEVSTITEAFNDGGVWNKYKVKMLPTRVWNENELDPYEEPKPSEPEEKSCADDCQSQHKSQDFDTILKDGFAKERRLTIAAMAMQGMLANGSLLPDPKLMENEIIESVASLSVRLADALIAKCGKGGLQ